MTAFANLLKDHDWEPIVLTLQISDYHQVDDSLDTKLLTLKNIYRVPKWTFYKRRKTTLANAEWLPQNSLKKNKSIIRSYLEAAVDFVEAMDLNWVLPSLLYLKKILSRHKVHLLFSSSPDVGASILGLILRLITKKPWVSEFRDPWINPTISYTPPSNFSDRIARVLERTTLTKADAVISIGRILKNELLKKSRYADKNKFHVLYNGYDKSDLKTESRISNKFRMTYLGTFGVERSPERFLGALTKLKKTHPDFIQNSRIDFIGEFKFDRGMERKIKMLIFDNDLSDILRIFPFLEYAKGLHQLTVSDVLLLFIRPESKTYNQHWIITSKLFQYLYTRKPILAMIPKHCEAARIIRECNAGEIVDPESIDGIADRIYKTYTTWKNNDLHYDFNEKEIEKYDRRKQVKQLADILNEVSTS